MVNIISKIVRKGRNAVSVYYCKFLWRKKNKHNLTWVTGPSFDVSKVIVGKHTYGSLNVLSWGHKDEALIIGNYCSIADEVVFLLGGNHSMNTLMTYPFKAMSFGEIEATPKGPIVIGDDVWIGYKSVILSGITIGQGAVIAAGAIVTKNVMPYTIVGGNPARVIKRRFPDEIIDKLLKVNLSNFDYKRMAKSEYETLNKEIVSGHEVNAILKVLNKYS